MSALSTGVSLPTAMSLAGKTEAATPKPGGHFRYALASGHASDSLNPAAATNRLASLINQTRGATLTEFDTDGRLLPALAERFEHAADAKTWHFDLRPGAEFHNGKTVTSQDVIASLDFYRSKDAPTLTRGLLRNVASLQPDGPNRVVITLARADFDLPAILSDDHLSILPATDQAIDPTTAIGAGAYALTEFTPGQIARFRKHPNHWDSARGHFDQIDLISIPDANMRQHALMHGDVDFIDTVDPKTVALLDRSPSIQILETPNAQYLALPMRLDTEPFQNPDLRTALSLAINRQELVDKVLLGHGSVGNDIPVHPDQTGTNSSPFDPVQAARLYRQSGHSGPIPLTLDATAFPGAIEAAQLIAANAAQAGFEIALSPALDSNTWPITPPATWTATQWAARPSETLIYDIAFTRHSGWNETAWTNAPSAQDFDAQVAAARATRDVDTRLHHLHHARTLLQRYSGALIPLWANDIQAHTSTVTGPSAAASGLGHTRIPERWWFA